MPWIELIDTSSNSCFFANIETGECDWELPDNAILQEKDSNQEEWWELFDENHQLPYYYNTKTMETVWEPPKCPIIPMAKLQKVMKDREDGWRKRKSNLIFNPNFANLEATKDSALGNISRPREKMGRQSPEINSRGSRIILENESLSRKSSTKASLHQISQPRNDPESADKLKQEMFQGYMQVSKKLPNDLISDIQNFSIQGFAEKYFTTQKRGFIFKKKIPIQELLRFQNYKLRKPLMIQSGNFKKEGLQCFNSILAVISI